MTKQLKIIGHIAYILLLCSVGIMWASIVGMMNISQYEQFTSEHKKDRIARQEVLKDYPCRLFEILNPDNAEECNVVCSDNETQEQCDARAVQLREIPKKFEVMNGDDTIGWGDLFVILLMNGILIVMSVAGSHGISESIESIANLIREPKNDATKYILSDTDKLNIANIISTFAKYGLLKDGYGRLIDMPQLYESVAFWCQQYADTGGSRVRYGDVLDELLEQDLLSYNIYSYGIKVDDPLDQYSAILEAVNKMTGGLLDIKDIKITYATEEEYKKIKWPDDSVGHLLGTVSFTAGGKRYDLPYNSGEFSSKWVDFGPLRRIGNIVRNLGGGKRLATQAVDESGYIVCLNDSEIDAFNKAIGAQEWWEFFCADEDSIGPVE